MTASQMQGIDRAATERYGIPSIVLMERAGVAVARRVLERYRARRAVVLCGGGNNGGDGLVVARELYNHGMSVDVRMLGRRGHLSEQCAAQLETVKKLGIRVSTDSAVTPRDLHGSVVIDAIFGTGLSKPVTGALLALIDLINSHDVPVVAVDIPSGISADDGRVLGGALRAAMTVTFGLPKRGHYLHPGAEHAGELKVEDIGFPSHLLHGHECVLMDHPSMAQLIPPRHSNSHKSDYGHVLVIGCSAGMTGAGLLAARSAAITGAGRTTLAAPESLASALYGTLAEEMLLPLKDDGHGAITDEALNAVLGFIDIAHATVAIGPGLGRAPYTVEFVRKFMSACTAPMVIDADALFALTGNDKLLRTLGAPAVLTPHSGEFERLSGMKLAGRDRIGAALEYADTSRTCVVLKGAPTVVASPEGQAYLNPLGSAAMAKGGSGDVLAGVIAAFIAQGVAQTEAAALGVYMHSLAADIATSKKDMHSVLASDIMSNMPDAFRTIMDGANDLP